MDSTAIELTNRIGSITDLISGGTWSSQQVMAEVAKVKEVLAGLGAIRGDFVHITEHNRAKTMFFLVACWQLGLSPVLVGEELLQLHEALRTNVNCQFLVSASGVKRLSGRYEIGLTSEPLAIVLASSGTTGDPKAIGYTFRNLQYRINSIFDLHGSHMERALCLLPTTFGHGLIANCLTPWLNGKHLVLGGRFDLSSLVGLNTILDEHQITFFSSVPSVWSLAQRANLQPPVGKFLRSIHCASAPLSIDVVGWLSPEIQSWELWVHYGLTECGSWITSGQIPSSLSYKSGWVGKEVGCRISCESPGQISIGNEIFVSSPSIPSTYLSPEGLPIVDRNGKMNTKDLGHIDEAGELILSGRVSDFINRAGEKISSNWLAQTAKRTPGVVDAYACGIAHSELGEEIGILVVLSPTANVSQVKQLLCQLLPKAYWPRRFVVTSEIPLTQNGKVDRKRCHALLLAAFL